MKALMGAHALLRNRVRGYGNALLAKRAMEWVDVTFGALEAQGTLQGKTVWKINQLPINIFFSKESLHKKNMWANLSCPKPRGGG